MPLRVELLKYTLPPKLGAFLVLSNESMAYTVAHCLLIHIKPQRVLMNTRVSSQMAN